LSAKLVLDLIVRLLVTLAVFAGFLFLPAWTLHWWRAWVFVGVFALVSVMTMGSLLARNEELIRERLKPPIQKGQLLADKIVLVLYLTTFYTQIIFIPVDVFHLHLLRKPGVIISSLGMLLFLAGWTIMSLAIRENAFAALVVRRQVERQQIVVDTGVYSIVRHPMYSGFLPLAPGMALWLESYAAALFSIVPVGLLVLRVLFEEGLLKRELPGYATYTECVCYRLIPFVW
jgi:protein-S-isoprenylcysteine O-methyltransferase Ste14